MKIELERHELFNLILACTAADNLASEGTKKWKRIHDKLMRILLEYDTEPSVKKVYKGEEGR